QQTLDFGSHMTLTDTPGMMWPKIDHDSDGFMLAACHAIGRNAVIDEEVAEFLAGVLLSRYPQALANRYKLDPAKTDAWGVVEGGGMDLEKAAQILLNDFRAGALGRISLETPDSRAAMLAEASRRVVDNAAASDD